MQIPPAVGLPVWPINGEPADFSLDAAAPYLPSVIVATAVARSPAWSLLALPGGSGGKTALWAATFLYFGR